MASLIPVPETNVEKPLAATEKKEQRARESEWENEGGSVKDEKRAAQAPAIGTLANDNGAASA